MSFGSWNIECGRGFTPAELTEAVSTVSDQVELRFVGGLSRAQAGFVQAAQDGAWVHFTLWDPKVTGMVLTFERETGSPTAPYAAKVETEVATTEGFSDDANRREAVGALAKQILDKACDVLDLRIAAFDEAR